MKSGLPALLLAASLVVAAGLLVSCATQSGSTLKAVTSVESGSEKPEKPEKPAPPQSKPPDTSPEKKGLEIVSTPSRSDVILDNNYRGRTPVLIENISPGRHLLQVSRDGYYGIARWINFTGDYMLYETTLNPITGFLNLSIQPAESHVTVADRRVSQGMTELPVGVYTLTVRAFGYADHRETVAVYERSLTTVDIALSPVDFAVTRISAVRQTVNPDNPGVLGSLEVGFSVSGPGSGEITVLDSASRTILSQGLPVFETWDQSYRWNCRDSDGRPLPDGSYTLRVSGRGTGAGEEQRAEIPVTLDRSQHTAPRALWSGGAGLLYAPSAEVLPSGGLQVSFLAAAFSDGLDLRAPAALAARIGLKGGIEIDAMADIIVEEDTTPYGGSFSARYSLSAPHGSFGFASALRAGVSLQFDPPAGVLMNDTFANFSAISIGVPVELVAGPLHLLAAADVVATLWEPFAASADPALTSWMYLRAGLLLDFGQVVGGVSASFRTLPFAAGFPQIAVPVQAGAEMHWLIPGTHILLSGILAAEFGNPSAATPAEKWDGMYLMGGGGLGFLY